MDQQKIKQYLNVIKRAVAYIEASLDCDDGGLLETLIQPPKETVAKTASPPKIEVKEPEPEPIGPTPEQIEARKKHIKDLLSIDCWPVAVPPHLVKDSTKEDQINRASAVLDYMVDRNMEDMSFLDFGCGEGWITQQALKRGVSTSVGYDVKESTVWADLKGPAFTTSLDKVKERTYDIIFLYDVLDHCKDPINVMDVVQSCLKKDGTVYVRCHPWTAMHGMHLYKQGLNLAYFQLFATWDELRDIIQDEPLFTRKELEPLNAYHWWFHNFDIKKERLSKNPLSDFFFVQSFKELLANEQQIPLDKVNSLLETMQIQFVDFSLNHKTL